MKYYSIIFSVLITLISFNLKAQINTLPNNNIVIGTNTSLDNAKLTIKGNSSTSWKLLALDGNTDDWFLGSFGGGGFFIAKDNFGSASSRFSIIDDKIGIGTNSPSYKLTINSEDENHLRFDNGVEAAFMRLQDDGDLNIWVHGDDNMIFTRGSGSGSESMRITPIGNVGIGTTSPDAKLAVKGQIHTQEVKVDLLGSIMPDFVFENSYKLRTLEETEQYIQTNKHLPEIPSAFQVAEDGILLKEMNLKLLQKVEELTLYLIEQNKEVKAQREEIEQLKKKINN